MNSLGTISIRVLAAMAALSLFAWLVADRSPSQRRTAAINRALEAGHLGGLDADKTTQLREFLQQLVSSAGLDLPVMLNEPVNPGLRSDRIQVFTAHPTARDVSRTARGNAIYDSSVDAIFVDLDVVEPASLMKMYANVRLSPNGGSEIYDYLAFVFLHELGHRVLHRGKGLILDTVLLRVDSKLRSYEVEADQFALRALRTHHERTGAIGRRTRRGTPEGFEDALAEMIGAIIRSLLFSAVPYSPFYADAAHPTFLSRTLGFIENTAMRADSSSRLRIVHAELSRIAAVAEKPLVEIQAPETIADIGLTPEGFAIRSKDGKRYEVNASALSPSDRSKTKRLVIAPDGPDGALSSSISDRNPAVPVDLSESFRVGSRSSLPVELPDRSPGNRLPFPIRSPELFIALLAKIADSPSLEGDRLQKASQPLIRALQAARFTEKATFMLLGIENRRAHALIVEEINGEELLGAVAIEVTDFSVVTLGQFRLSGSKNALLLRRHIPRVGEMVHAVPSANGVDYYSIDTDWRSNGPERTEAKICLWQVYFVYPPRLLKCDPLIAAAVPAGRNGRGWPAGEVLLMHTGWSERAGFVADVHGDSVYSFDSNRRAARVLFHPGGVRFVILPTGHAVFYAEGSYKAYVVPPDAASERAASRH